MRQLTHFGKRVMAGVLLVIASTLMIAAAIVVLEDWAYKIHISQDAFNVLFVFGLAIYSKILVDMVCIIKHGKLRDEI
jgi:hypothetical protein